MRSTRIGVVQPAVSEIFGFFFFGFVHPSNLRSPGSTVGQTTLETSIGLIAECINRVHKETQGVTVVLENMVRFSLFCDRQTSVVI